MPEYFALGKTGHANRCLVEHLHRNNLFGFDEEVQVNLRGRNLIVIQIPDMAAAKLIRRSKIGPDVLLLWRRTPGCQVTVMTEGLLNPKKPFRRRWGEDPRLAEVARELNRRLGSRGGCF